MNQTYIFWPILFSSLLLTKPAQADWVSRGAATQCSPQGFTLAPVVLVSSDDDPSAIPVEKGFSQLEYGSHDIHCDISLTKVSLEIEVFPAQGRGMLRGAGYVRINSMNIGDVELFTRRQPFNFENPYAPTLMRIQVQVSDDQIHLNICTEDGWGKEGHDLQCSSRLI